MSTLIYPTVASSLGLEVGPPEARSHGLGLADIFGAARPLSDFDLHSRGDEACGLEDRLLWRKGTYHRGGHLIAMDILRAMSEHPYIVLFETYLQHWQ